MHFSCASRHIKQKRSVLLCQDDANVSIYTCFEASQLNQRKPIISVNILAKYIKSLLIEINTDD
jgi:hypothetical protein